MRTKFHYLINCIVMILFTIQSLLFVGNAQATPLFSSNFPVLAATPNINETRIMEFSDNVGFYRELAENLKSKERIKITTKYKSYNDFPDHLKKIIEIHETKLENYPVVAGAVSAVSSGYPIPMAGIASLGELPAKIKYEQLIIIASTLFGASSGAVIGTFFGGIGVIPGTIGGAVFGLVTGVVTQAFMSLDHRVVIHVSIDGTIIITIEPT
ncbi:hypothetical protein PN497_12190 [Sphaerospermopsis kisseleviana CS-549]|uniref:Glycine zipper family protein n=1 Tax=Sphaerospermopsis kisseleviana CS-549 TaxID=3021783 RepID=A0ABT4ZS73_9CYAN|nr:hypothetical protein [Sphaerospermopsis kisseleviana]MDB9442114.1 hypothetical protein [Sphaerospermopsis kisseleviana CS-549]BAZ83410.1 hypothetical protein NIES73_46970 [Sphaerospermopsis kisseleviana NIES-73]